MTPYYTSPDGAAVVYCARWETVVAAGLVPVAEVALVHADPPYGVAERTERAAAGRGRGSRRSNALATAHDFPPVAGDDKPYDPAPLLALARPSVLWGANHYGRVPGSPSWLFWDKREGVLTNDNADGELACSWVYARAKLKRGDLVFVPYMGSGPDLAACVAMGLRVIACEVEEEYCRVAVGARLHAAPVAEPVGPLFTGLR